MNYLKQFFNYLFSSSKKKISNMTSSNYSQTELHLLEVIKTMLSSSNINNIHCDTEVKKYYIIVDKTRLVIDGMTNKVFIFVDEIDNECDVLLNPMHPFIINDSVATDFIDMLVKAKHKHTNKIYEEIISWEVKYLEAFHEKVKKSS